MNDLQTGCKRLILESMRLKEKILQRAKWRLEDDLKELKSFKITDFDITCSEGAWAYFNYLVDAENMRLLIKSLSKRKRGRQGKWVKKQN